MMTIHAVFKNSTSPSAARVAFQFVASGNKQSGVLYVSQNVTPYSDFMAAASKAAKVACKRSGADVVELRAIVPPVR